MRTLPTNFDICRYSLYIERQFKIWHSQFLEMSLGAKARAGMIRIGLPREKLDLLEHVYIRIVSPRNDFLLCSFENLIYSNHTFHKASLGKGGKGLNSQSELVESH